MEKPDVYIIRAMSPEDWKALCSLGTPQPHETAKQLILYDHRMHVLGVALVMGSAAEKFTPEVFCQ